MVAVPEVESVVGMADGLDDTDDERSWARQGWVEHAEAPFILEAENVPGIVREGLLGCDGSKNCTGQSIDVIAERRCPVQRVCVQEGAVAAHTFHSCSEKSVGDACQDTDFVCLPNFLEIWEPSKKLKCVVGEGFFEVSEFLSDER